MTGPFLASTDEAHNFFRVIAGDEHKELGRRLLKDLVPVGRAIRDGQLVEGELHAIYLLESTQRRGLGTLLVRQFVRQLRLMGLNSMAVWVLARNPSRNFYEALGGSPITQQQIERGGESFVEIAYAWPDLSDFESQFTNRP